MSGIDFTVFKSGKDGIFAVTTHKDAVTGDNVLVKITHSGVCGTDEHMKGRCIGLGHEGVGVVEQVGPAVTTVKVGDRVGWGFLFASCGNCDECLEGQDTYCTGGRREYGRTDHDQGSFGTHAVWPAKALHVVPESITSEDAAPLMCAGLTVFSVLDQFVRSTQRVGIVGIGGLGHLAIQFAEKMGTEVVVFSSTENKREEALALGAKEFYATKGVDKLDIGRGLDHLLVTTSQQPNWKLIIPLLKARATVHVLTVSSDNITVPSLPVVINGLRIQGSNTGSRAILRRTLNFAAQHNIRPIIQRYPLSKDGVEASMAALAAGTLRYRAVLVANL